MLLHMAQVYGVTIAATLLSQAAQGDVREVVE